MNGGTQTSALSGQRKTVRVVRCGGQEVKKHITSMIFGTELYRKPTLT